MNKKLLHTPEGVRDIYGDELERKRYVENKLHEPLKSYGYEDIETPTFEFFDVFSKEIGTTKSNELYKFFDRENNTLVLRPDFTPSIARCAAKYYMDDTSSIRFAYKGNTFANIGKLQGKLSENTQLGAELIGDFSVYADAEIVSLLIKALMNTGLKNFRVSIGNVEYFKGLCEEAGLSSDMEYELREFISRKNYFAAAELLENADITEYYRDVLLKAADMFGGLYSLDEAGELVKNKRSKDALKRLDELMALLMEYGVADRVSFDLSMLSKYNYYTGIIFKAYTYGVGDAIVTGGRYDKLLSQFGKDAAAVGFGLVVDEILEALERENPDVFPEKEAQLKITFNEVNFSEKLKEATSLRNEGRAVALIKE